MMSSLIIRVINRQSLYFKNITKPVQCSGFKSFSRRIVKNNTYCGQISINRAIKSSKVKFSPNLARPYSTQTSRNNANPSDEPTKKPGLVQRFKQMYKDYWYVVLPVHMTTSAIWFGSFYYCVRSGVDVIGLFESLGISEKLLTPIKESTAGYFALAFALYKLVTPLRYAVTVGGTTYAIKRLTAIGWIKPMPSRERLKEMLQERRDNIQDILSESKQHYQTRIKDKSTQVMDEMRRYKTEMRNAKNKAKK